MFTVNISRVKIQASYNKTVGRSEVVYRKCVLNISSVKREQYLYCYDGVVVSGELTVMSTGVR